MYTVRTQTETLDPNQRVVGSVASRETGGNSFGAGTLLGAPRVRLRFRSAPPGPWAGEGWSALLATACDDVRSTTWRLRDAGAVAAVTGGMHSSGRGIRCPPVRAPLGAATCLRALSPAGAVGAGGLGRRRQGD